MLSMLIALYITGAFFVLSFSLLGVVCRWDYRRICAIQILALPLWPIAVLAWITVGIVFLAMIASDPEV